MRALLLAALAAASTACLPAVAQTQRLPLNSRSERQVQDINRSLQQQQRDLRQDQQTQFEINQLRGQIEQNQIIAPRIGGGNCPAGSIGC